MPRPWIPARALLALLVVHATALCAIAVLLAMVIVDGASPVGVIVPAAFCTLLVAGAAAVFFAATGQQRRGRHNSAALLASAYMVVPPVALGWFLY
jgi:hypothetical protein